MRYLKVLPFALACLLLLSFCSSCSDNGQDAAQNPQNNQTQQPSSNQSVTDDVYREQLAYYERMVNDLQNEILTLKQQHYVQTFAYEQTIASLEAKLSAQDTDVSAKPENPETKPEQSPAPTTVFTYEVKGGTATLTSYTGNQTEVIIPAEVDGYAVTALGDNLFKDSNVTSVTLPASVTTIGWFAFYGCKSLQSVTLSEAVTTIGYAAFDGCPKAMTICGVEGSYAQKYAMSYGLQFKAQ